MDAKEKNISEKISSHLEDGFLIYGIIFIITGLLYLFFPKDYEHYKYVVIGFLFIIGYLINKERLRRKKLKTLQKSEVEIDLLRKAKWNFLLEKDDVEQKAILDLFNNAKIKGLYDDKDLEEEIKKYFLISSKVKIKVTRGYNLFFDDGKNSNEVDIFNHCINELSKNTKREIELLLHFPCLENEHTKKRALANKISPEDYIKSLLKVIKEVKKITNSTDNKNEITVKFYDDYEIKWRYYLFEFKTDKVLFLNYYDDKKSGADSAMLKIEYGSKTLCKDFDEKFDEIFNSPSKSKEIVSNLKGNNNLLKTSLCEHESCVSKIEELHKEIFL
jgi:hypothetical protein